MTRGMEVSDRDAGCGLRAARCRMDVASSYRLPPGRRWRAACRVLDSRTTDTRVCRSARQTDNGPVSVDRLPGAQQAAQLHCRGIRDARRCRVGCPTVDMPVSTHVCRRRGEQGADTAVYPGMTFSDFRAAVMGRYGEANESAA